MTRKEFIAQYQLDHPDASIEEVLRAWHGLIGSLPKKPFTFNDSTISNFCAELKISRSAFYKNKKKYLPLFEKYREDKL